MKHLPAGKNITASLENYPQIARGILEAYPGVRIFTFDGPLGAGKTSLIGAFGIALGSLSPTTSPTFSIVNEYPTGKNMKLFHFDLYRAESIEELFDIGIEDYINSGNYCFIEWPAILASYLPDNYLEIKIEYSDSKRIISY